MKKVPRSQKRLKHLPLSSAEIYYRVYYKIILLIISISFSVPIAISVVGKQFSTVETILCSRFAVISAHRTIGR